MCDRRHYAGRVHYGGGSGSDLNKTSYRDPAGFEDGSDDTKSINGRVLKSVVSDGIARNESKVPAGSDGPS